MKLITGINDYLNGIVWGPIGLTLLFGAALILTILTKGFQFRYFGHWIKSTIGSLGKQKTNKESKHISQFQSLCAALGGTIGTGNVIGVSTAIITGGPGAVFWMWMMALFGMITKYAENVLGIYYRIKNENGEWSGGPMYYLTYGLGKVGKGLSFLFAFFCICASFGIGNIAQVNSIAGNMKSAFNVPDYVTGIVVAILAGIVILGGLKRLADVTEKLVPFMSIAYIIGTLAIIFCHLSNVPKSLLLILKTAFTGRAVVGGGIGSAIVWGFKRGAFSNEAGLGSSVLIHSSSDVIEPCQQGMWGIFEVFADTIIICSLTSLVALTSGFFDMTTGELLIEGINGSNLIGQSFGVVFGNIGPMFVAIAILLFAFSTVLGWPQYGIKCVEYLFGQKLVVLYRILYIILIYFSATMDLGLAWDLSDTMNGLMMIPNLIGVIVLAPLVVSITKNYISRNIQKEKIKPILSYHSEIQSELEKNI